jgi:hypothetical protein
MTPEEGSTRQVILRDARPTYTCRELKRHLYMHQRVTSHTDGHMLWWQAQEEAPILEYLSMQDPVDMSLDEFRVLYESASAKDAATEELAAAGGPRAPDMLAKLALPAQVLAKELSIANRLVRAPTALARSSLPANGQTQHGAGAAEEEAAGAALSAPVSGDKPIAENRPVTSGSEKRLLLSQVTTLFQEQRSLFHKLAQATGRSVHVFMVCCPDLFLLAACTQR